jgi:hypothetical protein
MASCTFRRRAGIFCLLTTVTGCVSLPTQPGEVRAKGATELAVEAISDELLQECEGMPPPPENSVGALLQDGKEAMLLLAECMSRQGRLVRYIKPVVEAERQRTAR